jgi:uncharacterized LabA/DUF88 family protein
MAREKRVMVAADANNLSCEARENGHRIEFGAALAYARSLGQVTQAALYYPRFNGVAERERNQLITLKQAGFDRIVVRPVRQRPDGQHKSDLDTVLAMDVWEAAIRNEIDVLVLLSGDSDFQPLVEALLGRGIEVQVIGPDRGTAWELAVTASKFLYVSQVTGLAEQAGGPGLLSSGKGQPEPQQSCAVAGAAHGNGRG